MKSPIIISSIKSRNRKWGLHENWHLWIWEAYMLNVWKALEDWSKKYQSNCFTTAQEAQAAAAADLGSALNLANATKDSYLMDRLIGHDRSSSWRGKLSSPVSIDGKTYTAAWRLSDGGD